MSYLTRIYGICCYQLHCFRVTAQIYGLWLFKTWAFLPKLNSLVKPLMPKRLAMIFLGYDTISVGLPVNQQVANRLQPAKEGLYSQVLKLHFLVRICLHCSKRLFCDPKHMKLYYSLFISVVFPTHIMSRPSKKRVGLMAWDSSCLTQCSLTHKELCLIE